MNQFDNVTDRQQDILAFAAGYLDRNDRPPTVREIGDAVGLNSSGAVSYQLLQLQEMGFLERERNVSRGLRVTDKTRALLCDVPMVTVSVARIPLRGDIVAGEPLDDVLDGGFDPYGEDDAVELVASMLPAPVDSLFALRVRGDSMIDALVDDGDVVVLQKMNTYRAGDMVAAWIEPDQTTTLKHIYFQRDEIWLKPANRDYEPIIRPATHVTIQGKVVLVLRHCV